MISLPGSVCVSRVLIGWLQQHDAAENPIVRCHTLVTLKSSGLHIRLCFLFHWVQGARSSGPSFLNNTSKRSNSLRATGILFIPFTFALKRGWNDAGCAVYRCFCSGPRARVMCWSTPMMILTAKSEIMTLFWWSSSHPGEFVTILTFKRAFLHAI